jgi:DMSO/TMAO reductase YedYZ heme-binding membrane subunit
VTATAAAQRPVPASRSLTGPLCAAAAVAAFGAIAIGIALGTSFEDRCLLAARYTARLAFLLFLPVYVASSWNQLAPSDASRFALKRRRSLGLAFATAHTIHLGALTTFQTITGEVPAPVTLIVGGGAFVAMFAMVATSNDAAVRLLGKRWRTLHRIGVHWLWFVFAFSYSGRVADGQLMFVPFAGAAFAALGLRIAAWRRRARLRG